MPNDRSTSPRPSAPVLALYGVKKAYGRREHPVVRDISFTISAGETVGLFGESGCGKTTIGMMAAGFLRPTGGQLYFDGRPLDTSADKAMRRQIQMLFQHPEVSFNPRLPLINSMKEPFRFFKRPFDADALLTALQEYGIYAEHLKRYPSQLSGGELQRLALARAMLMQPRLLILDEPTSMLDVISQAQVIALLKAARARRKMGLLFISHDLALCELFCDKIIRIDNNAATPDSYFLA